MSHYLPIYISKFLVITNPDFYVKITTILYTKWVTPIGNGMERGGGLISGLGAAPGQRLGLIVYFQ